MSFALVRSVMGLGFPRQVIISLNMYLSYAGGSRVSLAYIPARLHWFLCSLSFRFFCMILNAVVVAERDQP